MIFGAGIFLKMCGGKKLSGTELVSQNRSDHGGREWARNHAVAEIAEFLGFPKDPAILKILRSY